MSGPDVIRSQNTFQLIPGLISCTGGEQEMVSAINSKLPIHSTFLPGHPSYL